MFTATAITVMVLAGAYSLFHSWQAVREYSDQVRQRRLGASVFADCNGHAPSRKPSESTSEADIPVGVVELPMAVLEPDEAVFDVQRSSESVQSEDTEFRGGDDQPAVGDSRNSRLFQSFQRILNDGADERLTPLAPEELPIADGDMVFGPATPMIAQLLPESSVRRETQRRSLAMAGYYSRAAWLNLNSIRFVLAFLTLVAAGFWLLAASPQTEFPALCAVVLGPPLMWALPLLLVNSKSAERTIDIERGLPDVLDMLNMAVSQGLTVPASLRRISTEIANVHPALAQELAIVNQQTQVGTLNHALRKFARRIDSPEVSSLTSLLIQAETTGTSIGRALKDYSDSMRSTLRERADARANAASFKLLFPTALCLMPSVFLFLLGPAIVEMTEFFGNTAGSIIDTRVEAIERLEQQQSLVVPIDN